MSMISRGVEMSIAGGVGEKVHVLSLRQFFFFSFFFLLYIIYSLLGTRTRMQR